ncbi:MAG TPA: hypothetical protein VKY92_00705 [Verrucomicrobiae bacterium]|nr:hypothetical protein [Verrucomicrobiae bacterium]
MASLSPTASRSLGAGLPLSQQIPVISWTNNLLTMRDARFPEGKLEIWYLEAFCKSGAWNREWSQTTLRHKTTLLSAEPGGHRLEFLTLVNPGIEVRHQVQAGPDELDLEFEFRNRGNMKVDLQWFEPACIRVGSFTGCNQTNYISRSFIFTENGLTTLDHLRRTTNALYEGGQLYLPSWVLPSDANPRPISLDHPINGLIGCFSSDNRWLLATATDRTHQLFEGVYVCLHSDPRLDGLAPNQVKRRHSKIYILPNDPQRLLARYRRDFPQSATVW